MIVYSGAQLEWPIVGSTDLDCHEFHVFHEDFIETEQRKSYIKSLQICQWEIRYAEWVEAGVRLNIPKRFIYSNMDIRAQRNQTINDYWGIKIDKDNLSLDLQHFNSSPPLCFNQLINLVECSIYVYFWFCFLPGT